MKFRREKKETAPKQPEVLRATAEERREAAETAAQVAVLASWPQKRVILRVIFVLIAVLAALLALYRLQGLILLIVLSIFFAYLIAPLVEFVLRPFHIRGRERIMPRGAAIGIVYLVLFGAFILTLWILLPRLGKQITAFAQESARYQINAEGRISTLNDFCQRNEIPENACNAINTTLRAGLETAKNYVETGLPGVLVAIVSFIPWLILIPIISFFLLKDADTFRRSALQMLPRGRWRWRGDEFFQDVNSTLAAYIRAQLTACLLIGVVCTIGFVVIGVPFPLVLGVLAGLLEFIPLVGPLVVAIIAALVTTFSPDPSTPSAIWVLLFLAVLRVVHDYAIYPRLVSHGIHLHPLAVILSILCGAELAGVAGIFLAIPVIAIATVSYRHWLEHRGGEGLVADILQPIEDTGLSTADEEAITALAAIASEDDEHPTVETTPEEMSRARPDLTTGELRMPKID